MSPTSSIFQIERTRKNLELAKVIQEDLDTHFFKHSMYGVKDALSSILALCDLNQMKDLPAVKEQVQKVNKLIEDVSLYSDNSSFNVQHVLDNVLKMLQQSYRDYLHVACAGSLLESSVKGNQTHLEQLLLYLMIEVIELVKVSHLSKPIQVLIQLSKKDKDAMIEMVLLDFRFDEVIRREVIMFANQYSLSAQINENEKGTKIYIRIPLSVIPVGSPSSTQNDSIKPKINWQAAKKTSNQPLRIQ